MRDELNILLIEDDNDDIELFQDALQDHRISYRIHIIKDGGEVGDYLETTTNVPDIIVMDLIYPKFTGGKF